MNRVTIHELDDQQKTVDIDMKTLWYNGDIFLMFRNPLTMKWTILNSRGESVVTHSVYRNDMIEELEILLNSKEGL